MTKYGVTARPELRSVRIKHGKDQFLAFTSDGINFVMRDEEVVDCINKCEGAKEGAARLVDQVSSVNKSLVFIRACPYVRAFLAKSPVFRPYFCDFTRIFVILCRLNALLCCLE